jgi:hypothetical protein
MLDFLILMNCRNISVGLDMGFLNRVSYDLLLRFIFMSYIVLALKMINSNQLLIIYDSLINLQVLGIFG